jgi:hypothetical protein
MDWSAYLVAVAWTGLFGVFGYGWLRCGNGHWRWRWLRRCAGWDEPQPLPDPSPNSPIYGLLALATLFSAALFWILGGASIGPSSVARYMNRTLGEAPLILALTGVAVIRKPWKG